MAYSYYITPSKQSNHAVMKSLVKIIHFIIFWTTGHCCAESRSFSPGTADGSLRQGMLTKLCSKTHIGDTAKKILGATLFVFKCPYFC